MLPLELVNQRRCPRCRALVLTQRGVRVLHETLARHAGAAIGEDVGIFVDVRGSHGRSTRNGKSIVEVQVGDGTGRLKVVFFNQSWRTRQLHEGVRNVWIFGKIDVHSRSGAIVWARERGFTGGRPGAAEKASASAATG